MLQKSRVALWDVCRSAYREGALDASIDPVVHRAERPGGIPANPRGDPADLFQWANGREIVSAAGVAGPPGDFARHPLRDAAFHEPGSCSDEARAEAGSVAGRATRCRRGRREDRLSDWDEDRERPLPVAVPHTELSDDALRGVVESFVLREGTDYGERDVSHEEKVAQVMRQLDRREARIMFDPLDSSVTIVVVKPGDRSESLTQAPRRAQCERFTGLPRAACLRRRRGRTAVRAAARSPSGTRRTTAA